MKADGETEHTLNLAGYTDGKATNHYQFDWIQMVSASGASQDWYRTRIPKTVTQAGDKSFTYEQLQADASGETLSYME